MGLKVSNDATTTLAGGISSSGTTIILKAGDGSLFPALGAGDWFYGTLANALNQLEVVKVTARSTDTLTVVRGQDSTSARAYALGDRFELRPTAAMMNDKADLDSPSFTTKIATPKLVMGGVEVSTITTFAKSLLDDTSAAEARTTLGLSYGPAFRAAQASSQALTSAVDTKVTFGTEEFDTNSNFAASRFTPTVPGYYQVNWLVGVTATAITNCYAMLFKNGAEHDRGSQIATSAAITIIASSGSAVVYMNGTTDYLEVYANFTGTSLSATYSRFSGCLMRPA